MTTPVTEPIRREHAQLLEHASTPGSPHAIPDLSAEWRRGRRPDARLPPARARSARRGHGAHALPWRCGGELIDAKEATAPINRRPPADRCAERPAPRGRSPRDSAASRAAVRAARADSRPFPRRSRSSICRLLDERVASRSIACSPSIHIRNGAAGVGRALCRRSTSSFVGQSAGKGVGETAKRPDPAGCRASGGPPIFLCGYVQRRATS